MKRFICLFLLAISAISYAHMTTEQSSEKERSYLVQLVNQINAALKTIRAAEKMQPHNQRIRFHYTAWRDAKEKEHHGLLEDMQEIKKGVEEKLNALSIEPRAVEPIHGDYLDKQH